MSIVASFTQVAQRVVRYAQRTSGRLAAYRQFSASAHLADPVTHPHRSTPAADSHARADRRHPPQDVNTSTPPHALHIFELPLHSRKGHKYHNLVRKRLASKSPPSTWLRATKPQNLPGRKAPQRHA